MSQQELKHKIIENINLSEDELLLTEIYKMLQTNFPIKQKQTPIF